jgi:hypothetical protein
VNIEQYCSVCKAVLEMAVVPTAEGDDDGVVWLRCPRCHGYLPKISARLGAGAVSSRADQVAVEDDAGAAGKAPPTEAPIGEADPPAPDLLADLDTSRAVPYRPWAAYAVGDVIHHLAWDDYGVVLAKETLPGRRRVVKVQFEKAGIVRLIEESGDAP